MPAFVIHRVSLISLIGCWFPEDHLPGCMGVIIVEKGMVLAPCLSLRLKVKPHLETACLGQRWISSSWVKKRIKDKL